MRQHVVIIGGTSGIGLGLVQYYLAQGHQVSTCGRDLNKIPSTLRTNPDLQAYRVDVTQPEQRSDFFDRVTQPIDLLFFCVGFYLNERVFDLDRASSQRMLSTNLLSFQA
ncbi:MAG: SDR family oxidoreductase, partial [Pseudomonadota bacterium]|nr:SDR family oxidoreductase [Pseudomonadota bacterium]